MSDYLFHPRMNDKNMDTLQYYIDDRFPNGNPFLHFHPSWAMECYCYGRFWEILDTVTTVNPYNLGRVSYYFRSTPDFKHMDYVRGYQWDIADYDVFYDPTVYFDVDNMDNYNRLHPQYTLIDQRILGSVLLFTENPIDTAQSVSDIGLYRILIGEKFISNSHYIGSSIQNGAFILFESISNQINVGLRTLTLRGVVENPIHDMFDNIIQGHPLYWKLPFWMYKRYLDRRRGLIYD